MPVLVAFGHSWVAGTGASEPGRCLVEVAARAASLTADNRGVSGSLSPDTARLTAGGVPAADVYLLMTGLNDARRHGTGDGSRSAYADALDAIFGRFRRASPAGVVVTLAQPPLHDYTGHAPFDRGSRAVLDTYNRTLRVVAGSHGVRVATAAGWDATSMLAADAVHPDDRGHACLAAAVVDALAAG